MRYLVLSDIHANYDALDTVLRKVRRKRFDAVLMLGDV
ncbi:MAG TPA: metallophosphoesterase, partial [Thermoanaerobaculia bacterium]|nr:metallophosphoesterase [Thermoanaerobaculia bacterium]